MTSGILQHHLATENRSAQRIILSLFVFTTVGLAADTGLNGKLTDPQGDPIPSATVRVLRRADSSRRETKSDETGRYAFSPLDPGEYRLEAESPGFPVIARTAVVFAGQLLNVDLQFSQLATQNQSVTVVGDVQDVGVWRQLLFPVNDN